MPERPHGATRTRNAPAGGATGTVEFGAVERVERAGAAAGRLPVVRSPCCQRELPDVISENLSLDAGSRTRRYTV